MPTEAKTFPCLAAICCDVIACHTLFRLFDRAEDGTLLGPWLVPWLLLSLLVYLMNRLFLRRARSIPTIILLNAALLGVHIAVVLLWCSTLRSVAAAIMAALFVLFTALRAVMRCFSPPEAMGSIRQLEACLAVFLMAAWFQAMLGLDSRVALPALGALAVSFAALFAQRLQGAESAVSFRARGFGSLGLFLVVLAVVMLLFMAFFSAPVGDGVLWVWNTALALVRWLWNWFCRFLFWFASLFPEPEPGEFEMLPLPSFSLPEEEQGGEGNPVVAAVLLALMLAGVLSLFIHLLWRLRKTKLGGQTKRAPTRQRVTRSRVRLFALLRRAVLAFAAWLSLRWRMLLLRNTPAGICFSIERRGLLLGAGKKRSESHCAYLRRVAGLIAEFCPAALCEEVLALANLLERGFYAGEPMPALPGREARRLRRGVQSALQRRLIPDADTLSRLTSNILPRKRAH